MDIIDFAIKMEREGEQLYRKLSYEASSIGLRKVFKLMADEEERHLKEIEGIKSELQIETAVPTALGPDTVFTELVSENSNFFATDDEVEVYRLCLQKEIESRDFYRDSSTKAISNEEKLILARLAEEEQKHVVLLENILEHVSSSDIAVDNAEFTHES